MRTTFYKNSKALCFKSRWTQNERKKAFFDVFNFFSTNRLILMFHVSFCRYFEYLHFLYRFFSYNQYLSFYKRNSCFLQLYSIYYYYYSIFFRILFSQVLSLKHVHFFSDDLWRLLWREMLVYNFFPIKFYFYWTILATRVYEGNVYIMRIKNRKQLNIS